MKINLFIKISILISLAMTPGCGKPVNFQLMPGTSPLPKESKLQILESPDLNFGFRTLNTSEFKSFTIKNVGEGLAKIYGFSEILSPFQYSNGAFPGAGGTCSSELSSNQSCVVFVTFQPVSTGNYFQKVVINYSDSFSLKNSTINLIGGSGSAGLLVANSSSYNFGKVAVNGSKTVSVSLTNSGNSPITNFLISNLTNPFSAPNSFNSGSGGECGSSIPAGSNCSLKLMYSPVSITSSSNNFSISYFDGIQNQILGLSVVGEGTTESNLVFTEAPTYDFGLTPINTNKSGALTLTNNGGATANLIGFGSNLNSGFFYAGGAYPGTSGTCSSTLASGASCRLSLLFSPSQAIVYNLTVGFEYYSGTRTRLSGITLKGTGQ